MEKKPNVLLIVTDEQRIDECSPYGNTPCITPNMDRLAKKSIVYENAYTSCPLCSPARASILTGLYPHGNGVTSNCGNLGCNVSELNDSPYLLPRILGAEGYSCGFNGKWHLGTEHGNIFGSGREPALPSHFGFEGMDFPGHGGIGMKYPQYKKYLKDNNLSAEVDVKDDMAPLPYGTWKAGEKAGVPHFITDYSISLMEDFRKRDKPFFLHHNFWGPHQPYFVPEEYLRLYDDIEIPEWENFEFDPSSTAGAHTLLRYLPGENRQNWKAWERLIKHKYAFVTYIDRQIGRMLDYLEESGQADNTVVIFTTDHGDNLGGHGGLLDKGFVHYEDTHHIPLMVRIPGSKGARSEALVSQVDVYPTVLEAAGIDLPEHIHDRPLSLSDVDPREYVVTEFHGLNSVPLAMRTLRMGKIKYGWTCCSEELYDLDSDPYEMKNLAGNTEFQDLIMTMRHNLVEWMKDTGDALLWQYKRSIT